jgi:hypothetical protein
MKLHKMKIAERQIHTAIDIFLAGNDYLSVVTLAGAGEDILGKLLARHSQKNAVDNLKELDKRISGGREFKIVNQEINGFRNSLKHANDETEDEMDVAEGQEHAIAMLSRSLHNYNLLEKRLSNKMEQFLQWLRNNRPDLFKP